MSAPTPTAAPSTVLTLRGSFLVGSLLELARDPLALLMQGVGHDMTELKLGPKTVFLLNHPDLVRTVFVDRPDDFDKRTVNNKVFRLVFGNSLVTSDGDYWKRQRRIAAPAFHHQRIRGFATTMCDSVDRTLEGWRAFSDGDVIDFDAEMITLTLDVVSRCLIGAKSTTELAEVLKRELLPMLEYGSFKMPRPWYPGLWAYTPRNRRFLRGREAVREAITRIIAERHAGGTEHEDLLSMLMSSVDEETGERMDDIQLRDEVITIVLAGYETTTNLLDWTFFALAQNPDVRAKLEEELERVLGDRPRPDFDDLGALVYTEAVIKESMRMYPPAWLMVRRAPAAETVLGRTAPPGSLMFVSPYVTHRRPDHFPDPERFLPERFIDASGLPKLAYLPFGGGRRTCIGNGFAMVESKIALAQICRRFRFEVAPGQRVEPHANVMLKPRSGLRMTLHRRTGG